jgi:hypothetical protein
MDMSSIRLDIDRLVLKGFQPLEAKSLTEELRSQLSFVLSDPRSRHEWARSHSTPVLKLGPVPLETGAAGAGRLGKRIGQAVGKGLKP